MQDITPTHNILLQWIGYYESPTFLYRTSLLSKAFAEFLGCFVICFIRTVAIDKTLAAITLVIMIHYTANISGGHLNMFVTLSFMFLGHNNPIELIVYWISQLSGAFVGTLLAVGLTPLDTIQCTLPEIEMTAWKVFGWEAVCMFMFILPLFSVVWFTQNNSGYGNIGPIIIGLAAYATSEAARPWTGGYLDPARNIASRLLLTCGPESSPFIGHYIAGQFVGAIFGSMFVIPYYGIAPRHWIIDLIYYKSKVSTIIDPIILEDVEIPSFPIQNESIILSKLNDQDDNTADLNDTTEYKCVKFGTLLRPHNIKKNSNNGPYSAELYNIHDNDSDNVVIKGVSCPNPPPRLIFQMESTTESALK